MVVVRKVTISAHAEPFVRQVFCRTLVAAGPRARSIESSHGFYHKKRRDVAVSGTGEEPPAQLLLAAMHL